MVRLPARASQTSTPNTDDLKVTVYPLLVWAPFFGADAVVPPFPDVPGGPDLPGGFGSTSAHIDGAALAGLSLEKARWRLDAQGMWGALTTERDTPLLKVDLDVVYGHISGGFKVYKVCTRRLLCDVLRSPTTSCSQTVQLSGASLVSGIR